MKIKWIKQWFHCRFIRTKAQQAATFQFYLWHAITLSHQVIYQLISQNSVFGLTHLKTNTHTSKLFHRISYSQRYSL